MNATHQAPPPPAQMMQMITGFWTSCCIYTAAKLEIADHLGDSTLSLAALAEKTRTHVPSLYRLMRALSSVGIFQQLDNGDYSNTTLSSTLQSNVKGSMKAMALTQLGDHYNAWGQLSYSVKTGGIAFDFVEGMPVWQYYEAHPEEGRIFMQAMNGLSGAVLANIIPAYDFSSLHSIVDVGGGIGTLMMGILDAFPHLNGIIFDEEYVIEQARVKVQERGLADRCTAVAGSFFETLPAGADAYMMKMIVHDWDDEQSIRILQNCHRAMAPHSKLLIIESVLPSTSAPHPGLFMDINMMTMTGGRERTEAEFADLLQKAGLKLNAVIPTHSPMFSIVEAVRA